MAGSTLAHMVAAYFMEIPHCLMLRVRNNAGCQVPNAIREHDSAGGESDYEQEKKDQQRRAYDGTANQGPQEADLIE